MRVVDVHTSGDQPIDLMLHPRLTVLTGPQQECSLLSESLARAFVLAGNGLTGNVEYSSFHMPLDQTTVVSLDLPGEGFRVITSMDLPEFDSTVREQAGEDISAHRLGWEKRLAEASGRSQELRRRFDATAAAVEVGRQELQSAAEAVAELDVRAESAVDRPQQLAAEIETALAELAAAEAQAAVLGELAPVVAAAFDPSAPATRALRLGVDPREHRDLLGRARRAELLDDVRAAELDAWLEAVADGRANPNPALAEMLDEVDGIERRWAELSRLGVEEEPTVIEARQRLEQLDARLVALQELAASGILADRARAEIDRAHADRTRVEGERHLRSGGLEAAVAEEQRVLGTYGFESYLDYTIALSTRSVGEAVNGTLERVRTEKVGAADALEAVRGQAAAQRASLSEERAVLRQRIHDHSGVEAEALTVDVIASVPELPAWLGDLGDELHRSVSAHATRRGDLLERVQELEAERDSGVDSGAELRAEAVSQREVAGALEALVDRASQEYAVVEAELAEADRVVEESTERLAAIERQAASLALPEGDGYSAADVASMVTALTPTMDPPGPDPVPVLMVDAFAPLGRLATQALEAIMVAAVRVQLVYVTTDPAVIDWADRLTPSAGQLARLDRPSWLRRRLARRQSRREHQNQ